MRETPRSPDAEARVATAPVDDHHVAPGAFGTAIDMARLARLAWLLCMLVPLPWVVVDFLPPVNHDAAALLHFAGRWLDGERLYVDLIDINPPLIFVLNLVPALVDRLTPVNGPTALVLCTVGWIAIGFRLAWPLLQGGAAAGNLLRGYLLPPLLLFLMVANPGVEFAQREHLMLVAALPYLFLAERRAFGEPVARGLVLAIAAFATVAFALKPHFLVLPLLVELGVLSAVGLRRGWRDPVPWVLGSGFAVYGLLVVVATPAYLRTVVPLAMAEYLQLGNMGPFDVLLRSPLSWTALLLVPLALAAFTIGRPLARLTAMAAIAGVVCAMSQGKGWPYHLLPAETFTTLLAAVLLCDLLIGQLPPAIERRQAVAMLTMVAFLLGAYYVSGLTRPMFLRQANFERSQAGQLLKRFGHEMARGPTLVLSPGLYPHFPVVNYAGTTFALRFMTLWPIQGVYAKCLNDGRMFRRPEQMRGAEAFAFNAVVDDFVRFQPRVIVVDNQPGIPKCGRDDFDFVAYFRQNPRFDAGWQDYHLIGAYDRYRVYLRGTAAELYLF